MRFFVCSGLIAVLCTACSDGSKNSADAAAQPPDGSLVAQDAATLPEASIGTDASSGSDGGEGDCAPARSATARIGKAGGTLTLCGASVEVGPDILTDPIMLTLRVVELPRPLPYSLEQAGLAFALEVDGTLPALPEPPFALLVPHARTTRHLFFYRVAEQYQELEACTVNEEVIGQRVGSEGTYVALVDTEDFPDSRTGLGTGTLETSFDGQADTFDLDSSEFDTYAIFDQGGDGTRTYTLSATKPLPADNTAVARLTFSHAPDGTADMIEVTYGDLNGLWSYLPFDAGTSQLDVTSTDGSGIEGTFSVELKLGEDTKILTGSFEVRADKYRYPPSLSCGTPEG